MQNVTVISGDSILSSPALLPTQTAKDESPLLMLLMASGLALLVVDVVLILTLF
jgi:hypothetical protein